METTAKNRIIVQIVWGILLVLMGIGVFIRIPQITPQIEQIENFQKIMPFVKFCFWLMGIILIGGGSKKIYDNYHKWASEDRSEK